MARYYITEYGIYMFNFVAINIIFFTQNSTYNHLKIIVLASNGIFRFPETILTIINNLCVGVLYIII